jgi:hypothetical protein
VEQVSMSTNLCVIMATRLGCTVMRRTLEFGGPRGLCMGDGREERPGRSKRDKVLRPILQKLAGQSLRAIAAELDRRGIKSWSGKPWNAVSVRNAMVRLGF